MTLQVLVASVGCVFVMCVLWLGGPSTAVALFVMIFGATTGIASYGVWRRGVVIVPSVLLVVTVAAFVVHDFSPAQPATRCVKRISVGASRDDVQKIIAQEFAGGRFPLLTTNSTTGDIMQLTFGDSSGSWDAAILQVKFDRDRVVSAEFLAD